MSAIGVSTSSFFPLSLEDSFRLASESGAAGVVLAPLAAFFIPALAWALWVGVAAAAGLALTMVVAAIIHISRKEFAYTWKANLSLFAVALATGVALSFVQVPLFS